ncbi:MAG: TetR/AcrR family transcriptional regulator [Polyangiales bacterium]
MSTSKKESRRPPPRRRGRPPIGGRDLAEKQAGVLDAAGRLLGERSSSDITVDLLVQEAGTSRPTLYRWFPRGIEQVMEMLYERASADLMARIVTVVASDGDEDERIEAGICAFFDWGLAMGPLAFGFYRECFEVDSLAHRYRQRIVSAIIAVIRSQANLGGFEHASDLEIETLVGWIESAGGTLFRRYPVSRADADRQVWLTTQMAHAMLAVVRDAAR